MGSEMCIRDRPEEGGELGRLRARVDELVDEQRLLRFQVEQLSLLVGSAAGRGPQPVKAGATSWANSSMARAARP